jgi:hypothetical protein
MSPKIGENAVNVVVAVVAVVTVMDCGMNKKCPFHGMMSH